MLYIETRLPRNPAKVRHLDCVERFETVGRDFHRFNPGPRQIGFGLRR